jgi:hypothetical protein
LLCHWHCQNLAKNTSCDWESTQKISVATSAAKDCRPIMSRRTSSILGSTEKEVGWLLSLKELESVSCYTPARHTGKTLTARFVSLFAPRGFTSSLRRKSTRADIIGWCWLSRVPMNRHLFCRASTRGVIIIDTLG